MSEIKTPPATKEYRDNYDRIFNAGLVQLEERLSCKQDVEGSTPSSGSKTYEWPWKYDATLLIKTIDGDITL